MNFSESLQDKRTNELVSLQSGLPTFRFRVATKVTYMWGALNQLQTSNNTSLCERVIGLLGLLPRYQIIICAMNNKCRRAVIATYDLSQRTDSDNFFLGRLRKVVPFPRV